MKEQNKFSSKRVKVCPKQLVVTISIMLLLLLTISAISATYISSSSQYTRPGISSFGYLGSQGINFPRFDEEQCKAGQDFIIQISPLGCTPSVVRSDLLEEQNVPVFCQLAATKINPLIKVEAIDSISFKGQYPKEVSGVGFHPARAAVKGNYKTLLNSPVLENIGYTVIVLKKQEDESAMPDWVQGNLTATIKYDIENAFGIGKATYYLPEMNDDNWNAKYNQYGFWQGKGFLRAERIDQDGAVISIYRDENNKISTINLAKGKTSQDIYLPGFYCMAALQLRLDSLDVPDTRAKLNINGEITEVKKGDKFLEDACSIRDLNKYGLLQKISISCDEDEGSKTFPLIISPKIKLIIGDREGETHEIGDYLYDSDGKQVYLGYIGSNKDSEKKEDLFVYLYAIPNSKKEKLTTEQIYSFGNSVNSKLSWIINPTKSLAEGKESQKLVYGKKETIFGTNLNIIDYAGPENKLLDEPTQEYYDSAMGDYRLIINNYPSEKEQNSQDTFGEKALFESIKLAHYSEQKRNLSALCREFDEYFSKSTNNIKGFCGSDYKLSNSETSTYSAFINGRTKDISFEGISEPSEDEYSATISVKGPSGSPEPYVLRKLLTRSLSEVGGSDDSLIQLTELKDDSAEIKVVTKTTQKTEDFTLSKESSTRIIDKYTVTFNEITSNNQAKITVKRDNTEKTYEISREKTITLNDFSGSSNEKIEITNIDNSKNTVSIKITYNKESSSDSRTLNLKKNVIESFGGYTFTLTDIKLKKQAKITVNPKIDNAKTQANFSFKIGIEKRAIQLTPEKIKEKIKILNETIQKWEKISNNLGTAVKGFKAACVTTGTYLTVKNLFDGFEGKAGARHDVTETYRNKCNKDIKDVNSKVYEMSMASCLLEYNKEINDDVEALAGTKQAQKDITETDACVRYTAIRNELANVGTFKNAEEGNEISVCSNCVNGGASGFYSAFEEVTKGDKKICDSKISLNNAETLELYNSVINGKVSGDLKKAYETKRYSLLYEINSDVKDYAAVSQLIQEAEKAGLKGMTFPAPVREGQVIGYYSGLTTPSNFPLAGVAQGTPIQGISFNTLSYYLTLEAKGNNEYQIVDVYNANTKEKITDISLKNAIIGTYSKFVKLDASAYQNKYENPKVTFWDIGEYKKLPAVVPFDIKNGWYAATEGPDPSRMKAYTEAGAVSYFYICNVMKNSRQEFNREGRGDDKCLGVREGSSAGTMDGINQNDMDKLIIKGRDALRSAATQYGNNKIKISGVGDIEVGDPAVNLPGTQCEDFMSPEDCHLLFNVCDPVVCPSSRCNFGGQYAVSNVIQSGIIGGVALCLPNIKEGIYVPVCLSGIKAGVDGLLSVYQNYHDCLQENLDSGKTIGVCDEIHSIYLCEFMWREALPLAKFTIPKIIEGFLGGAKGGGEYLNVQEAWDNSGKTVDYMTQYYAANSFEAFKVRSTDQAGSAVCRNFVSARYPASGDFFDALIEPDVPVQYHAWFHEIPFTSASVPPISQYKVFYHIYAGKDSGAYYSVYLTSPSGSSYYQDIQTVSVASGYIAKGDYASETKDFTAAAGYQKLCINVNGKEECGFDRVTTSFALDYVEDQVMKDQLENKNIKTEKECISGSPSLYGFTTPNIQEGAADAIDPEIYKRGIVRVCATDNPGKGTDNTRWIEVGYCGDEKTKCYLDKTSIDTVIKFNATKDELKDFTDDALKKMIEQEGYFTDQGFNDEIKKINEMKTPQEKINEITQGIIDKAFYNLQKAKLLLERGLAYGWLAKDSFDKMKKESTTLTNKECMDNCIESGFFSGRLSSDTECSKAVFTTDKGCCCFREETSVGSTATEGSSDMNNGQTSSGSGEETVGDNGATKEDDTTEQFGIEYKSPIFEFQDGTYDDNLYYKYDKDKWHWSLDKEEWIVLTPLKEAKYKTSKGEDPPKKQLIFLQDLAHSISYEEGLKQLIDRTKSDDWGASWKLLKTSAVLSTDRVEMNHEGVFSIKGNDIIFQYDFTKSTWTVKKIKPMVKNEKIDNLIKIVVNGKKDFYEGAKIIFDSSQTIGTFYDELDTLR